MLTSLFLGQKSDLLSILLGWEILHIYPYYFEEERLLRQTKLIMILVIGSVKCESKLLTKQRDSGFVSYFPDVHTIGNECDPSIPLMGYQDEKHTPPSINIFVLQQVNIKSCPRYVRTLHTQVSNPETVYFIRNLLLHRGIENLLSPEKIHTESFLTFWRREWG